MNWKHCYLRKTTEEEKVVFDCDEVWDGQIPEIDEDVLIYQNGHYDVDCMTDVDVGVALYNNDYDDFHWCELEAPDIGNGDKMSLIDEVKNFGSESHKKWFDRFFDDLKIEEKLKRSAMKGFSGYKISISKKDEYLARRLDSQKTVDLLKQRLGDGFDIEIKNLESSYKIFGKRAVLSRDLCIYWTNGG